MNERDELAEIISHAMNNEFSNPSERAANTILADGYRKPRTIRTVEELDALPVWSVVLSENIAHQKYDETDGYDWAADGRFYNASQIALPATVLHEGVTQ